ncbi:MAG: PASTA domain-containing protein [Candidatus Hydrogenedentes bacterium]|nr:PASTA domain-containing protein [Candidatus Hydrogenedentota bacterium]
MRRTWMGLTSLVFVCCFFLQGCVPPVRPVAAAGPDQTVVLGATVTLDGSASTADTAASRVISGYIWAFVTVPAGSSVTLQGQNTDSPTFVPDFRGDYVVSLVVQDSGGDLSIADEVRITVLGPLAAVPDVTGQTQAAAEAALAAAGFVAGDITTATSATVPAGLVISQEPTAGTLLNQDSAVNLVISTGAPEVAVPGVTGLDRAAARLAIEAAGFVVGAAVFVDNAATAGEVLSQDPAAGTLLAQGSAIDLQISNGNQIEEVPALSGLNLAQAIAALESANLTVGMISYANSDTVPSGEVISQSIAEGSDVTFGATVDFTVSSGPDGPVTVPNLVGLTDAAATAALNAIGLFLGDVSLQISATVPAGSIVSQNPTAGSETESGSSVNIVVSSGATGQVSVPDVAGLSQAEAEAALIAAGLNLGAVTQTASSVVPAGNVISQDPAAGGMADFRSNVSLVISTGPAQVTAPDLAGLSQAAAAAALTAAGLVTGSISQATSETVAAGNVISQNPPAGTLLNPGSAVDLVISLGPETTVSVPDVVGETEDVARGVLEALNLVVAVTYITDAVLPEGEVSDQDPDGGAVVDMGSTVTLVVVLRPIAIAPAESYSLLALKTDPVAHNVLQLFSAAYDRVYRVIFVSGVRTQHIGVFSTESNAFVSTLDTGINAGVEKHLTAVGETQSLYVRVDAPFAIRRMDVESGAIGNTLNLPSASLDPVYDPGRDVLYVLRDDALDTVDPVSMAVLDTVMPLSSPPVDAVFDEVAGDLYVLARETGVTEGHIAVYDPDTQMVTETVTIDLPGVAADSPLQLFWDAAEPGFVVRTNNGISAHRRNGTVRRQISFNVDLEYVHAEYDAAQKLLVVLGTALPQGSEVAGLGSLLHTYNAFGGTGNTPIHELAVGAKALQFALAPEENRLFVPDAGTASVFDVPTNPYDVATPHRLGQSVDALALSQDGTTLFGVNHLGGGYVFGLNLNSAAFQMYMGGTRASTLQRFRPESGDETMAVLNDWDASISLLDVASGNLTEVTTDLTMGSTSRTPALAIDAEGSLAFLAYPELGQVLVANLPGGTRDDLLEIPGANTGDTGDGPGQMQLLHEPGRNLLYVLEVQSGVLHIFDGNNGFSRIRSEDVSPIVSAILTAPNMPTGWMFYDGAGDVLFLGPQALDPETAAIVDRELPVNGIIFGMDLKLQVFWVLTVEDVEGLLHETVTAVNASTLDVIASEQVRILNGQAPVYVLDAAGRRIVRGKQETASIDVFNY